MNTKLLSFITVLLVVVAVARAGDDNENWKEQIDAFLNDVCEKKEECTKCMKDEMKKNKDNCSKWKELSDEDFLTECKKSAGTLAEKCEAHKEKCESSCEHLLKMRKEKKEE